MATYNAIFYDRLKTESDQKDLLIAQLKAEIFELKDERRGDLLGLARRSRAARWP